MSESKKKPESDHDILIRVDCRTEKIEGCLSNHLRHHWMVTMAIVVALLSVLGLFIHRAYWGN